MNSATERNNEIPNSPLIKSADPDSRREGDKGGCKNPLSFYVMEEKHLPEILEIEKASFSDPWSEDMFRNEISSPFSISRAAYDENGLIPHGMPAELIGYCILKIINDEGHIMNLAVHPGKRKMGYGKALLSYLLKAGSEMAVSRFVLEVGASNLAAINLYIKNGFAGNRLRKKYYATGEDAYEMIMNV